MEYRKIAKELHESVNHTYDGYNYILHLDAVESVHQQFKNESDFQYSQETYEKLYNNSIYNVYDESFVKTMEKVIKSNLNDNILSCACYFHDSIEDARQTYNDLLNLDLYQESVEIVYALTNEKGRNRAERASDSYYQGIRETLGASFVKMCDRIANVRYSRMMGSSMFEKYRKENSEFMEKVDAQRFPKMSECLINLFE